MKLIVLNLKEGGRAVSGIDKIPRSAKSRVISRIKEILKNTLKYDFDLIEKIIPIGGTVFDLEEYNDLDIGLVVSPDNLDDFIEAFESKFLDKKNEELTVVKVIFGSPSSPQYKVYICVYNDEYENKKYEVDLFLFPNEKMITSFHTVKSAEERKDIKVKNALLASIAFVRKNPKYLNLEKERFSFHPFEGLGKKSIEDERQKATIVTRDSDKILEILLGPEGKEKFKKDPSSETLFKIVLKMPEKERDEILSDFFNKRYPAIKNKIPVSLQKQVERFRFQTDS